MHYTTIEGSRLHKNNIHNMKKLLLLTLLAAATVVTGCKKDDKTEGPALTLNKNKMTLTVSSLETLTVTAPSAFAADPNLRWVSQSPTVASVGADGQVKGLKPGQALVYGYVEGQNAVRGECLVTVTAAALALTEHTMVANAGELLDIEFQYSSPMTTSWNVGLLQSDTSSIMKILKLATDPNALTAGKPANYDPATGKGKFKVVGVSPGDMWLKVFNAAANPKGKATGPAIDSVLITIKPVAVTSFDFDAKCPDQIAMGDDTQKVLVEILPKAADYRVIYYKSLNTNVLTVNAAGKITPVAVGTAAVIAQTDDGQIIRKNIDIIEGVANEFGFTEDVFNVTAGSKVKLSINTKPAGVEAIINVRVDNNGYQGSPLSTIGVSQSGVDGSFSAIALYGTSGTGSAQVIATTTNSDGDVIADTCIVNVNALSPALVLLKAAYYGDNLGTETFVTAYLNNYSNLPVTLRKATLFIAKGTVVAAGDTLTSNKVVEVLDNLNINTPASVGVSKVSFAKVPSVPAQRKGYKVTYVFQAGSATYTLTQAVVAGNGASFVGKK